jgi:hypothetical protein
MIKKIILPQRYNVYTSILLVVKCRLQKTKRELIENERETLEKYKEIIQLQKVSEGEME